MTTENQDVASPGKHVEASKVFLAHYLLQSDRATVNRLVKAFLGEDAVVSDEVTPARPGLEEQLVIHVRYDPAIPRARYRDMIRRYVSETSLPAQHAFTILAFPR